MRRAAKTDRNQSGIVQALRAAGASVTFVDSGDGFPDLAVGFRGANYLLEVKDPAQPPSARKLTPAQERWHRNWRGQRAVIETAEDAFKAIGALPGGDE